MTRRSSTLLVKTIAFIFQVICQSSICATGPLSVIGATGVVVVQTQPPLALVDVVAVHTPVQETRGRPASHLLRRCILSAACDCNRPPPTGIGGEQGGERHRLGRHQRYRRRHEPDARPPTLTARRSTVATRHSTVDGRRSTLGTLRRHEKPRGRRQFVFVSF